MDDQLTGRKRVIVRFNNTAGPSSSKSNNFFRYFGSLFEFKYQQLPVRDSCLKNVKMMQGTILCYNRP